MVHIPPGLDTAAHYMKTLIRKKKEYTSNPANPPTKERTSAMTVKRKSLGRAGEEAAAQYLKKRGYRLVNRNFNCRVGELDIVARDGPCLVFVEVRTRSGTAFGLPQESITRKKKYKLRQVASFYLLVNNIKDTAVRFDFIAVYMGPDGQTVKIEHIVNAI
jgi:putative endonuclease